MDIEIKIKGSNRLIQKVLTYYNALEDLDNKKQEILKGGDSKKEILNYYIDILDFNNNEEWSHEELRKYIQPVPESDKLDIYKYLINTMYYDYARYLCKYASKKNLDLLAKYCITNNYVYFYLLLLFDNRIKHDIKNVEEKTSIFYTKDIRCKQILPQLFEENLSFYHCMKDIFNEDEIFNRGGADLPLNEILEYLFINKKLIEPVFKLGIDYIVREAIAYCLEYDVDIYKFKKQIYQQIEQSGNAFSNCNDFIVAKEREIIKKDPNLDEYADVKFQNYWITA